MRLGTVLPLSVLVLAGGGVRAEGRVLDGTPVSANAAQSWCIAPAGPVPNWDGPAHPECKMVWREIARRDGRILYSARYAWPSAARSKEPLRVLTEILYEGVRGSRVVRKLYAVQDDEAHVRLEPLRVVTVGGSTLIESRVCMTGTGECGRELAAWSGDRVVAIKDLTVADIRSKLPENFDLRMNPDVDLGALSGRGRAWARGDRDCCPSGAIKFTLRLAGGELRVDALRFERRSG